MAKRYHYAKDDFVLARDFDAQVDAGMRLFEENERLRKERDNFAAELAVLKTKAATSEACVQALRQYTRHPGNCRVYAKSDMDDCTCGLTALLKASQFTHVEPCSPPSAATAVGREGEL